MIKTKREKVSNVKKFNKATKGPILDFVFIAYKKQRHLTDHLLKKLYSALNLHCDNVCDFNGFFNWRVLNWRIHDLPPL